MENKDNIYFKSTKVEMTDKYEKQVYLAMLAEQCSRYEDMMKFLEEMVNIKQDDLTDESGLQDLLFMPLTLMNAINTGFNSSCSSFSLGSLFGHNIELRCFTISDIIGLDLAGIIDVIISGIFVYLFSKHLRKVFDKTTNLESQEGDVI